MSKERRAIRKYLLTGVLSAMSISMVGCPPHWQIERPKPEDSSGSFIAGVFYEFMSIGPDRLIAKDKQVPELYVGRFGSEGRARWLRSLGRVAQGRPAAFLAEKDQIVVLGITDSDIKVDAVEIKRGAMTNDSAAKHTLFLAAFNRNGHAILTVPLAAAGEFLRPSVRRQRNSYEIRAQFRGTLVIPGKGTSNRARDMILLIKPDGTVEKVTITGDELPPKPQLPPRGASLPVLPGTGSKLTRASLLQPIAQYAAGSTCDYCQVSIMGDGRQSCIDCKNAVCYNPNDPWWVQDQKEWCCTGEWTWQCMQDASARCQGFGSCNCSHACNSRGEAMQPFCKSANANRETCVRTVTGRLPMCYQGTWSTAWDQACVNETNPYCPSPPL